MAWATGAHIHGPAYETNGAPILIPLSTISGSSGSISGSVSLTSTQMVYLLSGLTYVNIHSTTNAGGEIRGQIYPAQFTAALSGAAEVPATATSGSGVASMRLLNGVLTYNINFSNLTSAASAAHIHGPGGTGQNAGILVPFPGVPAAASGTISGSVPLTSQQLLDLVSGLTYVNIHTATYGGGEIRGQILPRN